VGECSWNSGASGRFTVNLGVYFPSVAALVGEPPVRAAPSEMHQFSDNTLLTSFSVSLYSPARPLTARNPYNPYNPYDPKGAP
jgi:hypothetical protein